jgi:hypothetical protein
MKKEKRLVIVGELPNDQLVVEVREGNFPRVTAFGIIHDYIAVRGIEMLSTEPGTFKGALKNKHAAAVNCLFYTVEAHLPIRTFGEVVLPALNSHEYLKPQHFTNYDKNGGIETAIRYYDRAKEQQMIAVRMPGNLVYDHITLECFTAMVEAGVFERSE